MAILSEEQTMMRDPAKTWVAEKSPVTAFRKMRDSGNADGFDRGVWKEMCEMGWAGILVPEDLGGSGLDYLTLGLVLEETGRTLTASPLFSTALVATSALLLAGNDAQKKEWLPKFAEAAKRWARSPSTKAHITRRRRSRSRPRRAGAGWTLTGKKSLRARRRHGGCLIVAARTSGKPATRTASRCSSCRRRERPEAHEAQERRQPRRRQSRIRECRSRARAMCWAPSITASRRSTPCSIARAPAWRPRCWGRPSQSFDITLEYLKTRTQFGQLIGTFQALQHRAAKMFTDLELARSCVEAAPASPSTAAPTTWRSSARSRRRAPATSAISSPTKWCRCMAASA